MTTVTTIPASSTAATATGSRTAADTPRPSTARRAAVAATGVFACLLPTVFTVNISRMLLTGIETDHRFHQVTGQGLILCALWLGGLLPMVWAGWSGRRPATAAAYLHLTFIAVGAVTAALAPGGGAPALMTVIAITGTPLWLALPVKPRLRGRVQLDPILAPVALLTAGLYTPFAVDQIGLQNDAVGYHALNPHFFDMAWAGMVLVVLAALASVFPATRRLMYCVGVSSTVIGAAGLAFTSDTSWSAQALVLGVVATTAMAAGSRLARSR